MEVKHMIETIKKRRNANLILIVVLLLLFLISCAHQSEPFNPRPDLSRVFVIAQTTHGAVAGFQAEKGLKVFLGIPYAQPPVGKQRFAPPQPMVPWGYVRPAYVFGPSCPQPLDEFEPASLLHQDEDCLSLNIWTPATDSKRRPVIVYIHGGGFIEGGSGDPLYNGAYLAKRGDIVVASINYRVGAFGFLSLDEFGQEFAGSGNLGLQDQIAGLTWIKHNIDRFGGDPDNITIMGESAGSASVMFLMISPMAKGKGLFHKVIAQSGNINLARTKDEAAAITRRFMELADVKDVEGLRGLSNQRMVDISEKILNEEGFNADLTFAFVKDGVFVPLDPYAEFAKGTAAGIPLLNGTNYNETRYWLNYYPSVKYVPISVILWLAPNYVSMMGDKQDEILRYYRKTRPDPGWGGIAFGLSTDMMFRVPHIRVSDLQSAYAPVWMYRFDWKSQASSDLGACHAIELPFVMGTFDSPTRYQIIGPNPPMDLSDITMQAWIAFARSGNPNHSGMPEWPNYDTTRRATMIFNERSMVQDDPNKAVRQLYQELLY
jgi:para-nitrobenzyl esterase